MTQKNGKTESTSEKTTRLELSPEWESILGEGITRSKYPDAKSVPQLAGMLGKTRSAARCLVNQLLKTGKLERLEDVTFSSTGRRTYVSVYRPVKTNQRRT